MATYKAEFLSHYYEGHRRPRAAYAIGMIHRWAALAAHTPRLANLAFLPARPADAGQARGRGPPRAERAALRDPNVDRISLRTRPAKSHIAAVTLVDEWRQRAAALGLDANSIEALCAHTLMIETPASEVAFASLAGPGGICAGGSVFSRTEAIVALVNHPVPMIYGDPQPLLVGAERLEAMVDEFLASQHVLQVTRGEEPLFTTVEMLGVQDRIVTRFTKGLHRGASLVPDDYVAAAIAKHSHLTDEQRSLVRAWCGHGHKYQAAIGRPGAGKTTTVAACATAWTATGYRVIGTAVEGEAARTLAAATGIECETVAWYLAHDDPQNGSSR